MRPYIKLNIKFYYYVLYSNKHTERINGKGIGIQGLSSNQLHSLLFPFPPINEQNIVTNKINSYFELLITLKKKIKSLNRNPIHQIQNSRPCNQRKTCTAGPE